MGTSFVLYRAIEAGLRRMGWPALEPLQALALQYSGAILGAVLVTKAVERPLLKLRDTVFVSRTTAIKDR